MRSIMPSRDRIVALLGLGALLVAVVVAIVLLALAVGDHVGVGRIAWFVLGAVVGALWALRSRLPFVGTAAGLRPAIVWVSVIVAGVATLALLPTLRLPSMTPSGASSSTTSGRAL